MITCQPHDTELIQRLKAIRQRGCSMCSVQALPSDVSIRPKHSPSRTSTDLGKPGGIFLQYAPMIPHDPPCPCVAVTDLTSARREAP